MEYAPAAPDTSDRARSGGGAALRRRGDLARRALAGLGFGRRGEGAEEAAGVGGLDLGDLLGGAGGHQGAALFAAFGAHVDDPVGGLDHVEVVLDDDDGVA